MKNTVRLFLIAIAAFSLSSCSYNGLVTKREAVKAQWANVEAAYQRRADLIPNLVETVKGAGKYEQETLDKVISDRAKATSVHLDVNNLNQDQIEKFQAAQNQLSGSLSRLLVVSENYPDLKATKGYSDLRVELTSTEDRVNFERKKYNDLVNDYNASTQTFPAVITAKMFGFTPLGYFKADEGTQNAPKVKFN
jgi:LemA protein